MQRSFCISEFTCLACGHKVCLPRKTGRQRGKDHIKHVWCIKCRDRTAHIEQKNIK